MVLAVAVAVVGSKAALGAGDHGMCLAYYLRSICNHRRILRASITINIELSCYGFLTSPDDQSCNLFRPRLSPERKLNQ
jgi:hypothetical protein